MWRLFVLSLIFFASCASDTVETSEGLAVWLERAESRNDSERGYALIICSEDPLFQGAFIPFSVEVGSRSMLIERAPFDRIDESCIEVRYDIERGFQEDLLSFGEIAFEIDPEERIDLEERSRTRIAYAPERICIDSDGDNPFLSGFVSARIDGETLFVLDTCANETATEYVCEGDGRIGILTYACRDGCSGGSCRCLNSGTCPVDGSAVRI